MYKNRISFINAATHTYALHRAMINPKRHIHTYTINKIIENETTAAFSK